MSRHLGGAEMPAHDVTALLVDWRRGNDGAVEKLVPLVHDELRRLARRHMAGERPDHVLQATALVNEVYLPSSTSVACSGRIARTSSRWPPG
jgi:ECF sigma factor